MLLAESFLFGKVWKMTLILQICVSEPGFGFGYGVADKMHVIEKTKSRKSQTIKSHNFFRFSSFPLLLPPLPAPPTGSHFTEELYKFRIPPMGKTREKDEKTRERSCIITMSFFSICKYYSPRKSCSPTPAPLFGSFFPQVPQTLFSQRSSRFEARKRNAFVMIELGRGENLFWAFFTYRRCDERIGFHFRSNV